MPINRSRNTDESVEEREELAVVRAAKIGVGIQFLIIIVTLADCLRLEYSSAVPLHMAAVEPYIVGALIAAVCTAASVALYFFKEYRYTTFVAGGTVVALLAYKMWAIGF
jgi:hypothetical protein